MRRASTHMCVLHGLVPQPVTRFASQHNTYPVADAPTCTSCSYRASLCFVLQALRCMKLYLERLGCVFAPDGTCSNQSDIHDSLELVSRAVTDNEFLNYRPTITAAAVLYCERLHKGHLPFWPSSLSGLTSYSNARTPELSAAIGGAQRLWKQLVASRQPQQANSPEEDSGAVGGAAAAAEEPAVPAADSTPAPPAPAASEAAAADAEGAGGPTDKVDVDEVTAQLSAAKV